MSEAMGNTEIKMGSEKSFGLVFCALFVIIALYPMLGEGGIRWWSLMVAGVFLVAGLALPKVLRPLNRLWFRFGMLLNKIVSPIVMGTLFFLTVTPVGLLRRIGNADPLRQKFDPDVTSYWISIDPGQTAQSSMRKQF